MAEMSDEKPAGGKLADIFRQEALEHRFRAAVLEGRPLKLSSAPMRWTFWLLLATLAVALLFASVFSIDEYAAGPAVVRISDASGAPRCVLSGYLPARHLPRIHEGLIVRVQFAGLENECAVTLDRLEPRIVPAREVRRAVGDPRAFPSNEPAVVLEQSLDPCTFRLGAREVPLGDGMNARVELRIRSRSILTALLTGLRRETDP